MLGNSEFSMGPNVENKGFLITMAQEKLSA